MKIVRSDNGTEFTCMKNYFCEHGIIHETSCIATLQQNGRVERKHRHILNVARALRFQANLPIEFWGECILTAGYLINRTPSVILNGKTPYELLHGKMPSLEHLRVFGCLCYVHNQDHKGDKFASRSRQCVFVGYPYCKKGWRVYDLELRVFLISRDVVFCEDKFPYLHDNSSVISSVQNNTGLSDMENWSRVHEDDEGLINNKDVTTINQSEEDIGVESHENIDERGVQVNQ